MSSEGKELIFSIIPPGKCFGEIALLDGQARTADAIAVGDCVLFTLARSDFIPFLERHPQVAIRLLAVLCGRVRATSDFIERLAFQNCRWAGPPAAALGRDPGLYHPVGVRITCKLSQQEIGNLIATSRESVNKQLQAWQTEGWLTIEHGDITLLKPAALNRPARSS